MKKIIESESIFFTYENAEDKALKNINFSIEKGELVFIVGNSGSGKSTLLNIINEIIPEVVEGNLEGSLKISEKEKLKIYERSLIIGNVFQNPRSQFFTTNTTAELVFAMENYGMKYDEMKRRLQEIVEKFGVEYLLNREIFNLSSGERQFLALLSVLIMNPEVVIFDEPSANLDYGNTMRLRKQIIDLKNQGKTVIVADHRCFYLRGIIDKVLLMDNKTLIEFSDEKEFFNSNYGKRVVDLFNYEYDKRKIIKSKTESIKINHLYYKNILEDIDFSINKEETTVFLGVNGVGKTTLVKLISNVLRADSGNIETEGKSLYIMQDSDYQLFGSSCMEELKITNKDINKNERALEHLNLYDYKDKHPQSLSGGQKQRLQMAIAIVSNNEIIALDEPTSGLDKNSMSRVVEMIEELKKDRTIIVVSHDYEFIRKVADKIIYIKDKKIAEEFYLEDSNIYKLNNIYKEMEDYYG